MTGVEIRPARPGDCRALLGLIQDHARFEHSAATIGEGALTAILKGDVAPFTLFVVARGDDLLGYAALTFDYSLWRASRWAHLDCLYLIEEARGRGLGAKLLTHVQEFARLTNADRLEWQTPDWNRKAISFYRRQGASYSTKARFHVTL